MQGESGKNYQNKNAKNRLNFFLLRIELIRGRSASDLLLFFRRVYYFEKARRKSAETGKEKRKGSGPDGFFDG